MRSKGFFFDKRKCEKSEGETHRLEDGAIP
jgi:hypothetical protein